MPAGKAVEVSSTAISPLAPVGKVDVRGGIDRQTALRLTARLVGAAAKPCKLTFPRSSSFAVAPAPGGWLVSVRTAAGKAKGTSTWLAGAKGDTGECSGEEDRRALPLDLRSTPSVWRSTHAESLTLLTGRGGFGRLARARSTLEAAGEAVERDQRVGLVFAALLRVPLLVRSIRRSCRGCCRRRWATSEVSLISWTVTRPRLALCGDPCRPRRWFSRRVKRSLQGPGGFAADVAMQDLHRGSTDEFSVVGQSQLGGVLGERDAAGNR